MNKGQSGQPSQMLFSKLFEETKEAFTRFAYTYVKDWDTADDIFMESIMQCWQVYTDSPSSITKPYLLSAIRNRALNFLRDQSTHFDAHGALYDHQVREIGLRVSTLEACDPTSLFTSEIEDIVQKTLAKLPEQTRRIFVMSRYDNLSNAEIALRTGLSSKAVEYHIGKALRLMRGNLKDYLYFMIIHQISALWAHFRWP